MDEYKLEADDECEVKLINSNLLEVTDHRVPIGHNLIYFTKNDVENMLKMFEGDEG